MNCSATAAVASCARQCETVFQTIGIRLSGYHLMLTTHMTFATAAKFGLC